jgi:hypothetical protein
MKKWILLVFILLIPSLLFAQKTYTITSETIVGVTQSDFNILMDAAAKKDSYRWLELLKQGRAFMVSAGTKVSVLTTKLGVYQVRILSGPMTGFSGWLPREFVQ